MLSTCAYQVAYRFNTALKAIQKFSNIVRSDDRDETSPLFADERESEAFCHLIDNIVNLLEKAHGELEEFLQIVLTEMRALKPTVESVKASLKIETNQETRKSEKEELLKNDQQVGYYF
uniref:Uncharacterized protein n=1 Tax=Panagrolaimus superbus TaxID=310955 RepID=A0A914Y7Z1_9BILA